MRWKIFSPKGKTVIIRAESFNEALQKARLRDPSFCCGYVVEDDEE